MSLVELHNKDCLEVLRGMADNSVDLVYTDPPFYSTNLHFDKAERIDFGFWMNECKRVLKPNGVLVAHCDLNLLIELRSHKVFKTCYELIWQKNLPLGMLDCHRRPLRNHEFIGVFTNQLNKSTYNPQKFNYQSARFKIGESNKAGGLPASNHYHNIDSPNAYIEDGTRYPLSVLFCQNWNGGMALKRKNGEKGHPTQKPLALAEYIIKTYSNEGETVLDPFSGSGTTGVACKKLNRNFIGCELHTPYFEIAIKRIAAVDMSMQTTLDNG